MKFFCTSLLILLSTLKLAAQTNTVADTAAVDSSKISTLTIGASYGNTANYYGQTTAEKLPYGATNISYRHKDGLWASATALKLINTGSGISEVDLSAGYDFNLTKNLSGALSYTRFIFAKDSPLPQSINPNNIGASIIYDFKWLSTGLNADYVFGNVKDDQGNKQNDFYLSWNVSKYFDFGCAFSKNDYVTFEPAIQFIGGTQRITTEVPASQSGNPASANKPSDVFKRSIKLSPRKDNPLKPPPPTYVQSNSFNIINSNLILPLAYNRAHYTFEAAYQLSIPNKNFQGISTKNQSYFTLSFYYLFFKD